MKVTVHEYNGCFSIDLEAETMADAAWLVRFGMDRTTELRSANAFADREGRFSGYVVIGKSKRSGSDVPRRRGK